jgi:hypothetical protein
LTEKHLVADKECGHAEGTTGHCVVRILSQPTLDVVPLDLGKIRICIQPRFDKGCPDFIHFV